MGPDLRGALSRAAARVTGSRFAKPVARVVLVAAGLLLLAFVGRTAIAGALGDPPPAPATATSTSTSTSTATPTATATPTPTPTSTSPTTANPTPASPPSETPPTSHVPASKDDPVVLNTATTDDLRRLPGIGEKRASAILTLRTRLGRFRAVEDLLKVKGLGRATLRRLRPLLRIDPPSQITPPDGG
jgi:competence protein ComEA